MIKSKLSLCSSSAALRQLNIHKMGPLSFFIYAKRIGSKDNTKNYFFDSLKSMSEVTQ